MVLGRCKSKEKWRTGQREGTGFNATELSVSLFREQRGRGRYFSEGKGSE